LLTMLSSTRIFRRTQRSCTSSTLSYLYGHAVTRTTGIRTRHYSITSSSLHQKTSNASSCVKYAIHKKDASLHFIFSGGNDETRNGSTSAADDYPLILSPCLQMSDEMLHPLTATNEDGIVQLIVGEIERHYSLEDGGSEGASTRQFVGGMGENDGGVWFTSSCQRDTLYYYSEIKDIIQLTKQSRHGVPFGVYTSGWVDTNVDLSELGLSSAVVSLLSDNPIGYGDLLKLKDQALSQRRFGQVCSFLANISESGFPTTAAVAGGRHAAGGGDLAKALGAVDVEIYDDVGV